MKIKKVLLSALCLVLVAAISVGATLAYLTDRDSKTNVFTVGNVSIELTEDFAQGATLTPGVKIEKDVNVVNTGKNDAWVWVTIAIPTALDEATDASQNVIHFNYSGDSLEYWIWKDAEGWLFSQETINGVAYNIYTVQYERALKPGETTAKSAMYQVYMDTRVDIDPEGNWYFVENGEAEKLEWNDSNNGNPVMYVSAYAIQAEGFANVQEAYEAYQSQWGDNGTEYAAPATVYTTAEDMYAALEAGATDLIVKGVTIDENNFNGRYYKDRNIDFVDCTFTANMNYMYINNATFTNCTFDCGAANSAVHYDELFGDLVFNNCTFVSGKIQIGANKDVTGTVTFNDCVFAETSSTSIWSEMGIRVYSPAEFNGCEFNNRVVMAGSNGLSISFNACTMNGGESVYYNDNFDGIIRGGNIPVVTIND